LLTPKAFQRLSPFPERNFMTRPTAEKAFSPPAGSHLNLITCSGVWDAKTNSYTKRLVIFTDLNPAISVL